MPGSPLSGVLRYLRRVAASVDADAEDTTDGQLLERFVAQRDEAAYEALVRRHGPMVLGTCFRILNDVHDAEDAFQATFLVLARKAASIAQRESVGSWLYRIAHRTAKRAKAEAAARHAHQGPFVDLPAAAEAVSDLAWQELRPILDEELNRLSEKYRGPVVLCYLEEKTYAQAAKLLGVAEGTVSSRLARARDMLRKRLSRRGMALSSGLLATVLAQNALSAAVPIALLRATTNAALQFGASKTLAAGVVSAQVAALTKGVLQAMFMTQLKIAASVLFAVGLLGIGAGVVTHRALADRHVTTPQAEAPKVVAKEIAKPQAENQPAPKPKFENEFGYTWHWSPTKIEVEPGRYSMCAYPGGVACSFTVGKDAELLITLASVRSTGKSAPDYRPVVFDEHRKRYLPCQPVAAGTSADGANLSMAVWSLSPRDLPAENVRYVGIEALKPEGRKAIAARAIEQAKETEIEVLPSGQNGQPYDFVLTSMDGKKLRGRDLRGKVVLIDCWSSTCSPCLAMMPKLKAIYQKHHKDGLEIIGVSLDQDAETVQKTCRSQGMTWPQVLVPVDEKTRDLWYKAAGLSGIPRLLLIDRDGILHTDFKYEQLDDDVGRLLAQP